MAKSILADTPHRPYDKASGNTRETRALVLYRDRGAEIVPVGPDTYEVPSCTVGAPTRKFL